MRKYFHYFLCIFGGFLPLFAKEFPEFCLIPLISGAIHVMLMNIIGEFHRAKIGLSSGFGFLDLTLIQFILFSIE